MNAESPHLEAARRPACGAMHNVSCILWEPQNALNAGSVVRACRNFGVSDLRIVNPGYTDDAPMRVTAPNSEDYIASDAVRVFSRWEEAVEGLNFLYALTARAREERNPRYRLDTLLEELPANTQRVGFVFGREDHGLPNDIVDRCHGHVLLKTSEEYSSLNLAQAVLLVLSRTFAFFGEAVPVKPASRSFPVASADHVERLMELAETVMDEVEMFRGDQRENVLRTFRRVLARATPDEQEVATAFAFLRCVERKIR